MNKQAILESIRETSFQNEIERLQKEAAGFSSYTVDKSGRMPVVTAKRDGGAGSKSFAKAMAAPSPRLAAGKMSSSAKG